MVAVSTSPASPIAGSTITPAIAKTSSTSLPVRKRAMSKSWMVISRKRPPEPGIYSIGGGAGGLFLYITNHHFDITRFRSEKHTSEIQSRPHLVFRLLL